MTIKLTKHEKVLAVVPEYCSGPGWVNALVHVHIFDYTTCMYRIVYLQLDETTPEMKTLFSIGALVCQQLVKAVPTKKVKK